MMSTQQKTDVNVIAVENNSYSCIALDDEGRVWTWGDNNNQEQLGRVSAIATNRTNPHNRGGQVTETIYPEENLPFIIQISGSERNSLVLDREGNVWSWGRSTSGALGRTGAGTRPGKVEFPAGVKIKWIASAYYGGKAIDREGNIWVWGEGEQSNLGNGSNSDVDSPEKLTLDSNGDPLPTNFTKISSSDFHNRCATIAVTADGKVFTWGNDADDARGGAARPRQTGFHEDIKKIDVGNGTYGFLTHSGELWTWGDNTLVAGGGRQGHGDRLQRAAPKRIENVIYNGTKPAPKFKDFSIYAWSACAVDYEGNLYATGEDNNNKHRTTGTPDIFTKYSLPNDVPEGTKILIVAEGYYSTSHVDTHGNVYVTGNRDTFGVNHNDGSVPGRWVHFNGSGKPMFTVLSSSPTSETKRYNTAPKTTLTVETNIPCDEVKYVILYPEEGERYIDGERFYDKSFAEIEAPYYLKGTDPQLLLSPNFDLWSSRYYANPKISEEVFQAAYDIKTTSEKGMMEVVPGSGDKKFLKAELVSHNCIVWVQSRNAKGTTRAIYRFDNYYTQTKAWFEGVKDTDSTYNLYPPELVGGAYGLFLDRQGNIIPGVPPFGYDNVMPMPKNLEYWSLFPADQLAEETLEDGYTHRVDRSKEIFLTELSQKGNDSTKMPRVTFTYEKNPLMWVDATLYFVRDSGAPEFVVIGEDTVDREPRTAFAPKGVEHVDGQEPYLPPQAVDSSAKVIGYSLGTPPDGSPGSFIECDFPHGFKPTLNEDTDIFIVYTAGMVSVAETFIDISNDGENPIKNNNGVYSTSKNLKSGSEDYDEQGPEINGYVIVGHEITIGEGLPDETDYDWIDNKYQPEHAHIPLIEENATVRFLYKADANGNDIPDDEEGSVHIRWVAVNANNASYLIAEKTICGNGKQEAHIVIEEDKEQVLPAALYEPTQWRFRAGQMGDTAPYFPQGEDESVEITFTVGDPQPIFFYYDEDYNENEIADKEEGNFTEKYKHTPSGSDLTPPKADTISKWLGGQMYSKEAPLIANYVAVGYRVEAEGIVPGGVERVDKDLTGNVLASYDISYCCAKDKYTVTFLYKEDKNNNNIPDEEEGSVTVKWVGKTFAGNDVELGKLVIEGYIGDNVTDLIYPPHAIDEIWKLADSNVPDSITLDNTPQYYEYQYIEVPEFSTITVATISTDGNLDFYYQHTKRLTDAVFDVTAFTIPTYRVTGYVLYDNYGNVIDSGTKDTVSVDPSTGSQRIVFVFESTITTVVIRAVEAEDYAKVLHSQVITDALIGEKYAATAPYVDESWVLTGEVLQVIDVAAGTNYITFEYERATGNVTVLLKEMDASGQIIQVLSKTVTQESEMPIPIPNLSAAYYTQLSDTVHNVVYTGSPQTVEYYYQKEMMDVTIKAIDEQDGAELKAVSYTAAARKGESYTAIAIPVEWYTLIESNSKSVYADPGALDNTVIAAFAYKKDHTGIIMVRSLYQGKDNTEVELQAYRAKTPVGNKFMAIANDFPQFELIDEEADTVEIVVNGDENQNRITFEYEGIFTAVTIYMTEEDSDDFLAIFSHRAVKNESFTIYAPIISGYQLTSDSDVGSVPSVLPNGESEITFTYKKIT